jgi:hypothetical protein
MGTTPQFQPGSESLFGDIQAFVASNGRLAKNAASIEMAVALARQMFLSPVTMELSHDPAEPSLSWIVINARAAGDTASVRKQRLAWHARLKDAIGEDAFQFRLCVVPRV